MRLSFLLISFALMTPLVSCLGGDASCENEVLDAVLSPNGELAAVAFSRNCGATTGENIQISVLRPDEEPRGGGNALIIDQAPGYSSAVRPRWLANDRLVLKIPAGARVFQRNPQG